MSQSGHFPGRDLEWGGRAFYVISGVAMRECKLITVLICFFTVRRWVLIDKHCYGDAIRPFLSTGIDSATITVEVGLVVVSRTAKAP